MTGAMVEQGSDNEGSGMQVACSMSGCDRRLCLLKSVASAIIEFSLTRGRLFVGGEDCSRTYKTSIVSLLLTGHRFSDHVILFEAKHQDAHGLKPS